MKLSVACCFVVNETTPLERPRRASMEVRSRPVGGTARVVVGGVRSPLTDMGPEEDDDETVETGPDTKQGEGEEDGASWTLAEGEGGEASWGCIDCCCDCR